MTNGAGITSSVVGTAKSGDINISANNIVIDGEDPNTNILSDINNDVGGIGDTGDILVTTDKITLTNGGNITTINSGQGNAGDIDISADNISIDGQGSEVGSLSGLFSINAIGEGNGGDIKITTGSLSISNIGNVSSISASQGDAGNITINALDTVSVMGNGIISAPVLSDAVGNGGNIEINTPNFLLDFSTVSADSLGQGNAGDIAITTEQLTLNNFSVISADISGEGDAGNINIKATNSLTLTGGSGGSIISASVRESATGNAGDTNIETQRLTLSEGSQISNITFGNGNAGDITINTSGTISVDGQSPDGFGSGIFSTVELGAVGNSGGIEINTSSLFVTNNAEISAQTNGEGTVGTLQINAVELVEVSGLGSGLFSRTGSTGDAGTVTITTPELKILDNAQVGVNNFIETDLVVEPSGTITRTITVGGGNSFELDPASGMLVPVVIEGQQVDLSIGLPPAIQQVLNPSEGTGDAGTVNITAASIELDNGGEITAISAGGNGGEINIQETERLTLQDGSRITTTAAGLENTGGDGGNISIDAELIIAFLNENSDITANAFGGDGGNITIFTEGIFGLQERTLNDETNDINASSEFGLGGNISINTPDVNVRQEAIETPEIVETETLGANACSGGGKSGVSSFEITGKGGVPPEPTEPFTADAIVIEGKSSPIGTGQPERVQIEEIKPLVTAKGVIYPARGAILLENGNVMLTAYPTPNVVQRTPQSSPHCRS